MNQIPSNGEYCEYCPCLGGSNKRITCLLFGVMEGIGSIVELDERNLPMRLPICLKERPIILLSSMTEGKR